jgi:glycogen synthase
VLRNGIDLEECLGPVDPSTHGELRRRYDLEAASAVVLSVGRISANKGLEVLARALASIRTRLPADWRWIHVGDGTGRASLERRIRELGIAGNVRLAGFVDEPVKHNLFEIADVFVHPTLYEGSSIATLEALAHSRPVIATRAGGIPDKVIDGENGRLVRPGDVAALAAALEEIAALPGPERRRLGERSRRLCEERFLWQRIGESLVGEYERLLRSAPSGSCAEGAIGTAACRPSCSSERRQATGRDVTSS